MTAVPTGAASASHTGQSIMKLDWQTAAIAHRNEAVPKAVLVLEDGTVFRGRGLGAFGQTLGEVCFNTR